MKFIIESDTVAPLIPKPKTLWWNGTGWTDRKSNARVYTAQYELHEALGRMNADAVFAKPVAVR